MGELKHWGQLTTIDLFECEHSILVNKIALKKFSAELCRKIKMVPHGKPIIKRFGEGSLEGNSMMQFIETSSITAHLDDFNNRNRAFIDIFSCKKFDSKIAVKFCKEFFKAKKVKSRTIFRG